jgi:hypothetical protein
MPTPIDCDYLANIVSGFSLISDCDIVKDGSIRMSTPFQYPDGSRIDIFVILSNDLLPTQAILSDKGQTTAYLLDLHVKPWTTKKRKQMVDDICASLGVSHVGGEFLVNSSVERSSEWPSAMVRLAQACLRVADLAFTQRLRSPDAFQEEFEEFVSSLDRPYEPRVKLIGQFDKEVEIDFSIRGQTINSLVQTLGTSNQYAAHGLTTEAFRRWYDLQPIHQNSYQFVTIFDTGNNVFRDDDVARLGQLSQVIGFPAESDKLKVMLSA